MTDAVHEALRKAWDSADAGRKRAESEVTRLTEALHEVQQAHTNANSNLQLAEARCTRLTEALAAMTSESDSLHRMFDAEHAKLNAAEARVRELLVELDVTQLGKLNELESECASLRLQLEAARGVAESECAALRAKVEQLQDARGTREAAVLSSGAKVIGLEARLAAANALLEEIEEGCDDISDWKRRYRAHLAAQPATAPATFEHPGAEQVFNELRAARQPTAPVRDEDVGPDGEADPDYPPHAQYFARPATAPVAVVRPAWELPLSPPATAPARDEGEAK